MSQGKIIFGGGQASSLSELAGGIPSQVNLLSDALGALRLRPGIAAWEDFPAVIPNASPVIAIGTFGQYVVYVTADRKLWAIITPGFVIPLSDGTAATQLDGSLRPVMAETRSRLIIAGGGKPQKWEGTGLSARLGGSPPNFSHVATIDQRVVGNDSGVSGLIYWSELGATGAETWTTGLNFEEAESKPDPVIGLYESSGELAALGTRTIEMKSPDPTIVFSTARTMQVGVAAAHSFIGIDEQFMFLDTKRRAQLSTGRSFTPVSVPAVAQQFTDMGTVSDCWGMRHVFNGFDLAAFRFPTDGKTMVYNLPGKAWSEFAGYSAATGAWADFAATAAFHWEDQQITLIGLANGQIAKLDPNATDDLGSPIVVEATAGFETHGVLEPKHCQRINFLLRKGPSFGDATVQISYRDWLGPFCTPFVRSLGPETDVTIELRSLGTYRARQWRIRASGCALSLASAQETFTLGRGA